jgi:Ca2+-binding EF-hand superfamily protein
MSDGTKVDDAELYRLFCRYDSNRDGLVDEPEFLELLESLGGHRSNEILSLEFAAIDANADGCVDFAEFKAWWLDAN